MQLIIIILVSIFALYLLDQLGLWLERKGWLYYRHSKPKGGICGTALQELNALLLPSNRHVIEIKQNEAIYKKSEADASGESNNDKDEKNT